MTLIGDHLMHNIDRDHLMTLIGDHLMTLIGDHMMHNIDRGSHDAQLFSAMNVKMHTMHTFLVYQAFFHLPIRT